MHICCNLSFLPSLHVWHHLCSVLPLPHLHTGRYGGSMLPFAPPGTWWPTLQVTVPYGHMQRKHYLGSNMSVCIKQTLFPHLSLYLFGPSPSWNRTVSGACGLLHGSLTTLLHGFSVDAAAATQGSAVRKRSWSSWPCISCHQPHSSTLLLHLHDMCRTSAVLPRYHHNLGSRVLGLPGEGASVLWEEAFLVPECFCGWVLPPRCWWRASVLWE